MDPQIAVAAIGAVAVIAAAWLANGRTHRRVKTIQAEFSANHGTSAKDALNRIEANQQHMLGRFDQHVIDSVAERAAAHKEAIEMWSAIQAIAKSNPPEGDR